MQEDTKIWNRVLFIHNYFFESGFTFDFVKRYLEALKDRNPQSDQIDDLFTLYSSITERAIPSIDNFSIASFKEINFFVIESLSIESLHQLIDFQDIKFLLAQNNRIDSLVSLRKFTNMVHLDLQNNKVSNLEPIENFTKLRYLNLSGNCIHNTSVLKYLVNLRELELSGNMIEYLCDLSSLTNLEILNIGNNRIKSTNSLRNLKSLQKLYLGYNPMSNEELVAIKRSLQGCEISFEYHSMDDGQLPIYANIEIIEDVVFFVDYSRVQNGCHYVIYAIEAENNMTHVDQNTLMKRLVDFLEKSRPDSSANEIAEKIYVVDNDKILSCKIEYRLEVI